MAPLINKLSKFIILLIVAAALVARTESSTASKQKLLGLIKKLERLADAMQGGSSSAGSKVETSGKIDNEETINKDDEAIAAAPPTKKAKVVKPKDPNKSYCDAMECPVPTCTDKDIIYYGNLRKKTPFPPIHALCDSLIAIAGFAKSHNEVLNTCCVYNMTQMSFNNDKILGCAQEAHDRNKKTNPTSGVKYWTSAKWSAACNDYVWCPEKEIIAGTKWKKGFPKTGQGNCVGIHLGNSDPAENGLYNGKCSEIIKLFCIEADVIAPSS